MIPLWLALAGGLGAGARFVLDGVLTERMHRGLPTATLVINVVGSFLLGLLTGCVGSPSVLRTVIGVGLLGGFTTFSTASVELVRLVRAERPWAAVALASSMLVLCLLGAGAGFALGRMLA